MSSVTSSAPCNTNNVLSFTFLSGRMSITFAFDLNTSQPREGGPVNLCIKITVDVEINSVSLQHSNVQHFCCTKLSIQSYSRDALEALTLFYARPSLSLFSFKFKGARSIAQGSMTGKESALSFSSQNWRLRETDSFFPRSLARPASSSFFFSRRTVKQKREREKRKKSGQVSWE